jgi:hypothetical protein
MYFMTEVFGQYGQFSMRVTACFRQLGKNGLKEKPPETERQFCAD